MVFPRHIAPELGTKFDHTYHYPLRDGKMSKGSPLTVTAFGSQPDLTSNLIVDVHSVAAVANEPA